MIPDRRNEYYRSDEELQTAIAEAMRTEYKMIVDAGFLLQLDDARSAVTMTAWCRPRVSATIESGCRARSTFSITRSRAAGRPHPLSRVLGLLAGAAYQRCAAERDRGSDPAGESRRLCHRGANPRHEHEWQVWKNAKLGAGQVLIPGVISHATNVVEHPELVAERITRLARVLGRENVIAGTDCGFAQGPFYRRVHPSVMWAKLKR